MQPNPIEMLWTAVRMQTGPAREWHIGNLCKHDRRFLLGRSIADPVEEFGKLRNIGHMGHVREYSAREVAHFLDASGFAVQSIDFRSCSWPVLDWKRKLLRLAYRIAPRRFRRDIVIVARKAGAGPRLSPLVPAAEQRDRPA